MNLLPTFYILYDKLTVVKFTKIKTMIQHTSVFHIITFIIKTFQIFNMLPVGVYKLNPNNVHMCHFNF